MRLRHNTTSPFVRKVMVVAKELGADGEMDLVPTDVWAPDSDISNDNPLKKVPALMTDEGTFVDSSLICRYLNARAGGALVPHDGQGWRTLQLYELADGIMEATVACVVETLRREKEQISAPLLKRHKARIRDTLEAIESDYALDPETVDIATITLGVALGYLDFRLPDFDWRTGHPRLTAFYEGFSARPSMQATIPHG